MSFTTVPAAGAKLRGSVLASLFSERTPIHARKTADEIVNSSATLQNDDALFVSVAANTTYRFFLNFLYTSGSTPDIKYGWTFPTGLTMRYSSDHYLTGVTQNFYTDQTTVVAADGNGAPLSATAFGLVIVGANAGTLQLQWAQNTSNASNTTVHAGSSLTLWKVE